MRNSNNTNIGVKHYSLACSKPLLFGLFDDLYSLASSKPLLFGQFDDLYSLASSMTLSTAALRPSAFLPPACAKWG